jgi:hypothetical protein
MAFPLTAYIEAALEIATYDKLEDWILVGLRLGHPLPVLAGPGS